MSLKIIKAGIQDTIQDLGRYNYQWLGINPGGAMDRFSARVVNILVGNHPTDAVVEMHFPAAAFLFETDTMIAIGGADFSPTVNGEPIPLWQPVIVNQNSVLQFEQLQSGARCYLGIQGGLQIVPWLNSYSTNLKVAAGGFHGKALQKGDTIGFQNQNDLSALLLTKELVILPWAADIHWDPSPANDRIAVIPGNEWDWMEMDSQNNFLKEAFLIQQASDRMGYRLNGSPMVSMNKIELISTAVNFGTVQLLPDGQLIVLMADHQTTGGYPRIAHIITAHLSRLAQRRPGEKINFYRTDIPAAEKLWVLQQQHLLQLQNACKFRLEEFLT
jgi:antagonist of KipI